MNDELVMLPRICAAVLFITHCSSFIISSKASGLNRVEASG